MSSCAGTSVHPHRHHAVGHRGAQSRTHQNLHYTLDHSFSGSLNDCAMAASRLSRPVVPCRLRVSKFCTSQAPLDDGITSHVPKGMSRCTPVRPPCLSASGGVMGATRLPPGTAVAALDPAALTLVATALKPAKAHPAPIIVSVNVPTVVIIDTSMTLNCS